MSETTRIVEAERYLRESRAELAEGRRYCAHNRAMSGLLAAGGRTGKTYRLIEDLIQARKDAERSV